MKESTILMSSGVDGYSITYKVYVIVFNATFKSISVISWQSVLLVEETVHQCISPLKLWVRI